MLPDNYTAVKRFFYDSSQTEMLLTSLFSGACSVEILSGRPESLIGRAELRRDLLVRAGRPPDDCPFWGITTVMCGFCVPKVN
jgi:hypothetical protein